MKAIVSIGISASGKSTDAGVWVKGGVETDKNGRTTYGRVEVNRDSIRREIAERNGGTFSWDKWNWKHEKEVTIIAWETVKDCALRSQDVYISDTNLHTGRRTALIQNLEHLGYEVEIREFPVTLEEAWKRDARRADGVGHSVIAKQYQEWIAYKGKPFAYVQDKTLPKCILFDIDGTMAHMNGKRGAFEWHKVGVDDIDDVVRSVVVCIYNSKLIHPANEKIHVIAMSGRDSECREETLKWLNNKGVPFDQLYMREAGDMRKDTVVKHELFDQFIRGKYDVQLVIDDRPSVCRMWRDVLGLKVFQVGDPYVEF